MRLRVFRVIQIGYSRIFVNCSAVLLKMETLMQKRITEKIRQAFINPN